ncbi:MAG: hypothetical protein DMF60_19900 [Acidobacteria bacterium]|nr:MAG: hypothetical protein DMF60_19900 [Acidobacteriota bacterium]
MKKPATMRTLIRIEEPIRMFFRVRESRTFIQVNVAWLAARGQRVKIGVGELRIANHKSQRFDLKFEI